jgi:hypothetical protein
MQLWLADMKATKIKIGVGKTQRRFGKKQIRIYFAGMSCSYAASFS